MRAGVEFGEISLTPTPIPAKITDSDRLRLRSPAYHYIIRSFTVSYCNAHCRIMHYIALSVQSIVFTNAM